MIVEHPGVIYRAVNNLTKEKVAVKVYRNSSNQLKDVKVRMNGRDDE